MSTQPPPPSRLDAVRSGHAAVRSRLVGYRLFRPARGRIVAGVLAGLAQRFGVRPSTLRIAFVLSLLLPGPQVLLYVALWIIMPPER